MRLIFFGTPAFAIPTLKALLRTGYDVVAVVTQPDRGSGRGREAASPPVKAVAVQRGLTYFQPRRIKDRAFLDSMAHLEPEAIVVVAYGQILPLHILGMPKFGCINVHASLLPKYRGAAPINWAIIEGEEKTGITTMVMDEGMDTGPVLLQKEVPIAPTDTAGSLSEKLSEIGAELLIQTLDGLFRGNTKPIPQAGGATFAPLLKKRDGLISWSKRAGDICNSIRGMNPWPGAYTFLGDDRIIIHRAVAREGSGESSVVVKATTDEVLVGTGEGLLGLLEIQQSGKKAMDIRTFLRGREVREGMRFGE